MNSINQEIGNIIAKLHYYQNKGYMNRTQIEEIITDISQAYRNDNIERLNRMMDDVTVYMSQLSNENATFLQYVRQNMEEVAQLLNKSERTIYRKLKENSFTLYEKKLIVNRKKQQNDE